MNAGFKYEDHRWLQLRRIIERADGDVGRFEDGRGFLENLVNMWLVSIGPFWTHGLSSRIQNDTKAAQRVTKLIDELLICLDDLELWENNFALGLPTKGRKEAKRKGGDLRRNLQQVRTYAEEHYAHSLIRNFAKPRPSRGRNALWDMIGGHFWVEYMELPIGIGRPSLVCDFIYSASEDVLTAEMYLSLDAVHGHVRSKLKNKYEGYLDHT